MQTESPEYPYTESVLTLEWIRQNAKYYIISRKGWYAHAIIETGTIFQKGYCIRKSFLDGKGYFWNYSEVSIGNLFLDDELKKQDAYLTSDFEETFNHINQEI